MACSAGDIAKWSDVSALGAALEPLLTGDLSSDLFLADSFVSGEGKVIFRFFNAYDEDATACQKVQNITGQGFEIPSSDAVTAAISNGKAVLVIQPDSGADQPCFCCMAFKIDNLVSGVVRFDASPAIGSNCNVGTFDILSTPCLGSGDGTHAKGILNKALVDYYYHGALDTRHADDEDSVGLYRVYHSTCEGSDLSTTYVFAWDSTRSCYKLLSVEVPVTGFIGWLISSSEFSSLWSDFSGAAASRCVTEFDQIKVAGDSSTYLAKGCSVTDADLLWTLQEANGDGIGDPGAIVYSSGTIEKPWDVLTNGATNLCSDKRPLYCTTLTVFEALINLTAAQTSTPGADGCKCCDCESYGGVATDQPDPECPSGQFLCTKDLTDIEGAEGCIRDPAISCKICLECADLEDDYNICPLGITCPEGYEGGPCEFAECPEDCVSTDVFGWPTECGPPYGDAPTCHKCQPFPNCTCEALGYSSEMPTCTGIDYPHEYTITLDPDCEGTGQITCYECRPCDYSCPTGWSTDSCFDPNTGEDQCVDPQHCSKTDPITSSSTYCPEGACYICSDGCTCEDMGLGDPEVDCPAGQFAVDNPVTLSDECGGGGGEIQCRTCYDCGTGTCPEGWSAGGCDSGPCDAGFSCQETNATNPEECPVSKCHKCAPAFCTCADFGASDTPPTCPEGQEAKEVAFTKIGDCPGGAGTITCYECQDITCPAGASLGSCDDNPCAIDEHCTPQGANCYSCGPLTCEGYGLLPPGCGGTCTSPDQCQTVSTGGAIPGDCAMCVDCTSCTEAGYYASSGDCEAAKTNPEDLCEAKSVPQPSGPCEPAELSCYELKPAVYGCTNPYSPSFNSSANIDDGTCQTCVSEGCCQVPDTEEDPGSFICMVGGGHCDEACATIYGDCTASFGSSFTATNGVYYPSCYG